MKSPLIKSLIITLTLCLFSTTPAICAESKLLIGEEYLDITQSAIKDAKESVYVAMYLVNVSPESTDNPASKLLEELVNAKERGVFVKVILDDSKFNVNYNAYKLLKDAGVDVYMDSPATVLHGKGLVIDSRILITGSTNWTRASIYDNHEFSTLIESEEEAGRFLEYLDKIELSPHDPAAPLISEGVKIPVALLKDEKGLGLFLTNHAEKSFDLYLYLLLRHREEGRRPNEAIPIDYEELGKYLGYTGNYYFNVRQPLHKLKVKYRLISHAPWSKYTTLLSLRKANAENDEAIPIPYEYWQYGLDKKLSFPAKYMYLVALAEVQSSQRNPYWFRSQKDLSELYHISEKSIANAINELERENILEVYRHRPDEFNSFDDRLANSYRVNPLISQEKFEKALAELAKENGEELARKTQELSGELNEPKDIEKIKIYIDLVKTYGYNKVKEVNTEVASRRRETGFRSLEQVILLLKQ